MFNPKLFLLVLSFLFLQTVAFATPYIEPSLQAQMKRASFENKPVKMIVLFHNKNAIQNTPHLRAARESIENQMRANARASQENFYRRLRSVVPQFKFESLWIVNGAIMMVDQKGFAQVAQSSEVKAMLAVHKKHIVETKNSEETFALSASGYTYGLEKMGIPELNQKAPQVTGAGITVGVLDTGVDAKHADLKDKVVGWKDFVGDAREPYDDHGHGSHVSGTIAGGNTSGTAVGVAPGAKIIMAKIFSSSGGANDDDILKAMQWMADPDGNPSSNDNPSIVSNSWGGDTPSPDKDPKDDLFCQALDSWVKLGMLPVFANGNEGPSSKTVGLPGGCPVALAVGATDSNDDIASFSSRGPADWKTGTFIKPDVSAPGVSIISVKPGGGYQKMSGTSMATPHVAGLAALVYQVNPGITVENAKKVIAAGTKDLGEPGFDNDFGWGRVNAANSLKILLNR